MVNLEIICLLSPSVAPSLVKPRLSGRAACRQDAALQTKTLPVGAVGLSTATCRTSKKLDLCGLQPVAKTLANKYLKADSPNDRVC